MPALATHLEAFKAAFTDPQDGSYREKLNSVTAPTARGGQNVVRKTLGLHENAPVRPNDAKSAVLSAMLTPFAQSAGVGSCFATAPCLKQIQTKPLEVMQNLCDIVKTGTLQLSGGTPVPVIANIDANENALLRSWEYTVATLGARRANSEEHKTLGKAMFGGITGQREPGMKSLEELASGLPRDDWEAMKQTIQSKMRANFTFSYDPQKGAGSVGSDGVSSRGAFCMKKKDDTQPDGEIDVDEGVFKSTMKQIVGDAMGARGNETQINNLIEHAGFIRCIKAAYDEGNKSPWDLPSGGNEDDSIALLTGRTGTSPPPPPRTLFTPPTSTSGSGAPPNPTQALLCGLLDNLPGGSPGDMVTVSVDGVHGMNALPGHPSLAPLREGGAGAINRNVQTKLVEPSTAIATTPLPPEKAAYLQNKAMDSFVGEHLKNDPETLDFVKRQQPVGNLTPGQLKEHILGEVIAKKIERDLPRLRERNRGMSDDVLRRHITKDVRDALGEKADAFLLKELDYPKFVIADTNWGGPKDHTFMVVACDPATGDPAMWKQEGFSGELKLAGADYPGNKWEAKT
jgi:hypothetical protein